MSCMLTYQLLIVCQTCQSMEFMTIQKSFRPKKGRTIIGPCSSCNKQKYLTVYNEPKVIRREHDSE